MIQMRTQNFRRIVLAVVTVGLLVTTVGAAVLWKRLGHRPQGLVCDAPEFDFGAVRQADALSLNHEFVVRNTTSHPIRILKTLSSCGCTTANRAGEIVAPNASTTVNVIADWSDRDGHQSVAVTLVTDDPDSPAVRLVVAGSMSRPAGAWPAILNFGDVNPGMTLEKVFEVKQGESVGTPLRVLNVQTSDPRIVVRRLSADGKSLQIAGGPGEFAVRVDAPRTPGLWTQRVLIATSSAENPLVVQVSLKSRGTLVAEPSSIVFGTLDNASATAVTLTIRATDRAVTPSIQHSLVPEDASKSFKIERLAPGDAGVVKLRISSLTAAAVPGVATLRVFTSDGDAVDVPIVAVRQGR